METYLETAKRRAQLRKLESLASRPPLALRRHLRPRLGVLRRLISWLTR